MVLKPVFVHFVWDKDDVDSYIKEKLKSLRRLQNLAPLLQIYASVWEFEVLGAGKILQKNKKRGGGNKGS